MLTASMSLEATAVCATMDIRVMASLGTAQVSVVERNIVASTSLFECTIPTAADINECALGEDECDDNATCSNTEGSYQCTCDPGFTGNGFNCTSTPQFG